jgi:hypothetical protein
MLLMGKCTISMVIFHSYVESDAASPGPSWRTADVILQRRNDGTLEVGGSWWIMVDQTKHFLWIKKYP